MRSYIILGMCGLFIFQYFLHIQPLQYLVVILAILSFLASAPQASKLPRFLGIMMMTVGAILEFSKGEGIRGISDGIFMILPLICLLTLAPLLSIPLRASGYFDAIHALLSNLLHQPKKLYAGITCSLFLLSPILSLGSVRIINEFLEDLKLPSAMSAKSYLVGFSTSVMWSPYFASVSMVLYYLHIPFKDYIAYGIGMSVISLVIGNILFAVWEHKNPIKVGSTAIKPLLKKQKQQLLHLAVFLFLLLGGCLLIEHFLGWSMIIIVCIISLCTPILYGIMTRNFKSLIPRIIDFRDVTVPMMNNEIMLFMSAGLLGYAVQGTKLANGISMFLTNLAHRSFLLFALAIMIIALGVTYIGIHQIAVLGALAMQLQPENLGISNISLALLLLLAWSTSSALSPFSGLNLLVSRYIGISGVEVGLRSNGAHLTLVVMVGILLISFIG